MSKYNDLCPVCEEPLWTEEGGQQGGPSWRGGTVCGDCYDSPEEVFARAVAAVVTLADETRGVDGLHLNGDLAEWDWMMYGDGDSWLGPLADAKELIEREGGPR